MKTILPQKTMSWCFFVNILTKGLLLSATHTRELIKNLLSTNKNYSIKDVEVAAIGGFKLHLYNVTWNTTVLNRLNANLNIIGV